MNTYQVLVNNVLIKIDHRALCPIGDTFCTWSKEYAYVVSSRYPGSQIIKISEDGVRIPVRPLRHLMKGTLPEDVEFEVEKMREEDNNWTPSGKK